MKMVIQFIILKNIIRTAKDIGFKTLCEGVETKEQAEFLNKMKVRYAQGYLFYRPMHINDFEALIMDGEKVDYRGIYSRKNDKIEFLGKIEG